MRTQREKKFLTELHKARHKGPLKRGTMRAHELVKEIQAVLHHELPAWPPPRVGPLDPNIGRRPYTPLRPEHDD
jgi:hypothetical protein